MASTSGLGEDEAIRVIEWKHLDIWRLSSYVFLSSCSVRLMIYPFSFVKSRMQLQKQNTVYRSMWHALVKVACNEGFTGLYKGFLMTVPQHLAPLVYCNAYEKTREAMKARLNLLSDRWVSALAGGTVTLITQFIFVPTDIASQLMVIYNNPRAFLGDKQRAAIMHYIFENRERMSERPNFQIISAIYNVDGWRGFLRGYWASTALGMSAGTLFWLTYYSCLDNIRWCRERFIHAKLGITDDSHPYLFIDQGAAAATSSVVASSITNPIEILRLRIQVHRTSYMETLRRMWHDERLRVMTKGVLPRVINSCVYVTASVLIYETLKKLCVLPQYEGQVIW